MKNSAGNFQFGSTILPPDKVHFVDKFLSIKEDQLQLLITKMNFKGFNSFVTKLASDYQTHFFFVGGCVRDLFLGKEPKDIDIIIPHIDINELALLLSVYGDVDLVGKSFGVLKFRPFGLDDTIDVSVPRIEGSTGEKHTDFEVITNTSITLEEDLRRRDFTMNALAMTYNGYIFDPFEGIKDIENKVIRIVSNNSFVEDPLRMLRALQFAARFDFGIEKHTAFGIQNNCHLIQHVSGERIILEFEKGLTGNVIEFACDLENNGLWKSLFGLNCFFDKTYLPQAKTLSEFLYVGGVSLHTAANRLKISSKCFEELKALKALNHEMYTFDTISIYRTIFKLLKKSPQLLESKVLVDTSYFEPFLNSEFPKSFKELAVNGEDVMSFGYAGEEVGKMLKWLLNLIFSKAIKNEKRLLMKALHHSRKISL